MTFEHPVVLTSNKAAAWGASRQLLLIASPALCSKENFLLRGPLLHPSQLGLDLSWGVDKVVGPFYSLLEVAAPLSFYSFHIL